MVFKDFNVFVALRIAARSIVFAFMCTILLATQFVLSPSLLQMPVMPMMKNSAFAASSTGRATQEVISALQLSRISDLDFGQAVQGSAERTVNPGTFDGPENASFQVTGEPGHSFMISLPGDQEVVMTIDGGSTSNRRIAIKTFKSNPSGASYLPSNGSKLLFVGATREALKIDQKSGRYEGSFTIAVVY